MSIVVRRADLDQDREPIIETLLRHLTPRSTAARYDWLYRSGPHGAAHAWVATDSESQGIIGVAAAFPRRVRSEMGESLAWVLGDFCIDKQYRSLGPALQLQRVCLDAAQSEGVEICFDFPSIPMLVVYKRLGVFAVHHMLRLARPLKIDRKLRQLIKLPLTARSVSLIGNFVLSVSNWSSKGENGVCIAAHRDLCGEEFTRIASRMSGQQAFGVIHSAEYLNWRYLQNPLHKYELFTARREGNLLACAVFLHEGEDAMLVDLFGVGEETVLHSLIVHGVGLMAKRGVQTLSAAVADAHPWRALLERHGFKVREASPMVIYTPPGSRSGARITKDPNWLFMHGDRDS